MSVVFRTNPAGVQALVEAGVQYSRELAEATVTEAQGLVPKRSGTLARAIHVEPTSKGGDVVVDVPYARKIEQRSPYLLPAMEKVMQRTR